MFTENDTINTTMWSCSFNTNRVFIIQLMIVVIIHVLLLSDFCSNLCVYYKYSNFWKNDASWNFAWKNLSVNFIHILFCLSKWTYMACLKGSSKYVLIQTLWIWGQQRRKTLVIDSDTKGEDKRKVLEKAPFLQNEDWRQHFMKNQKALQVCQVWLLNIIAT